MTLTRRTAITGTLAATALLALPALAKTTVNSAPELVLRRSHLASQFKPVLFGDGIHDDTEALQAYLNGRRVISTSGFTRPYMVIPHVSGGIYRISKTLVISRPYTRIEGCAFKLPEGLQPFRTENGGNAVVDRCHFETEATWIGRYNWRLTTSKPL